MYDMNKALENLREESPADLVCLDDVQTDTVEWLWYPYIPKGKITILQGDPGEGKTTLALQLAALVSRGIMWGMTAEQVSTRRPANVIYQTAEDGLTDTIKPRLMQAKADCHHIYTIYEHTDALTLNDARLEHALEELHPALVILDPIQAYLGANVDMHRANEIRPVMQILAQAAQRYNCAVVLIGHMNKKAGDKSMYRGLGSIDFAAAARSILMMARDPQEQDVRVLVQVKSSLAKSGDPLQFKLGDEDCLMGFHGKYTGNLSRLLQSDAAVQNTGVEDAIEFFQQELAGGERRSAELLELAKGKGISKSQLSRARKQLGVAAYKKHGIWYNAFPAPQPE